MQYSTNLLKIHVKRGYGLAIRSGQTSDAHVVIRMGDQERKTGVVRSNANPEWNEQLTFNLKNHKLPFQLFVYNKGILGCHKLGEAKFFINPFLDALMRRPEGRRDGDIIETIDPNRQNCLADESQIVWKDGKVVQNMFIRLNNVKSGEVEIQLSMEYWWGLLKIHVHRGLNLAIRDVVRRSSDPYIVFEMGNEVMMQRVKTKTVRQNVNPEWNEELSLYIPDPPLPVRLHVYDKDRFSRDDRMGEAQFDTAPVVKVLKNGLEGLFDGKTIRPNRENQLVERSQIVWEGGQVVQNMVLRLKNVESGEVELQLRLSPQSLI